MVLVAKQQIQGPRLHCPSSQQQRPLPMDKWREVFPGLIKTSQNCSCFSLLLGIHSCSDFHSATPPSGSGLDSGPELGFFWLPPRKTIGALSSTLSWQSCQAQPSPSKGQPCAWTPGSTSAKLPPPTQLLPIHHESQLFLVFHPILASSQSPPWQNYYPLYPIWWV